MSMERSGEYVSSLSDANEEINVKSSKCNEAGNSEVSGMKGLLSVWEVRGLIPGLVESAQCRHRLATAATFLRSCVAQVLSCGDGPHYSLHTLT